MGRLGVLGNGNRAPCRARRSGPVFDSLDVLKSAAFLRSRRTSRAVACRNLTRRRHAGAGGARSRAITRRLDALSRLRFLGLS
jgi:hypothetical protein